MANEVRITVTADAGQANQEIGGLKSALGGIATVAAGIQLSNVFSSAADSVRGFVSESINQASALNESINAVNVVFGLSAEIIQKWGETTATSYGLSRNEFNKMATPMGSMLKNMGYSLDETANLTIAFTKRASDMASVFDTDVKNALSAIQAGLRGEIDPLEQFGVSLSATRIEARALADTGKTVASSLTDQEKAAARVALIFDQTAQVEGDFINTSDQLANSQRKADAELKTLQASMGEKMLPVVLELTKAKMKLVEAIGVLIPAVDFLARNMDVIAPIIAGIGAAIGTILLPKMVLATAAIWAQVAALTAQAIAFAAANPWMAAAAIVAGVATAAYLKHALASTDVSNKTKDVANASEDASTSLGKMSAATKQATQDFGAMTFAQLENYVATELLKNSHEPAWVDSFTAALKAKYEVEKKLKDITDELHESITGEKAAQDAQRASQEASNQAKRAAADAEQNQIRLTRELNYLIDQQRAKLQSTTEQMYDYGKSIRQASVGTFQQLTGAGLGGKAAFDISGQIASSELAAAQARLAQAFTAGQGPFAGLDPGAAMAAFNKLNQALNQGAAGQAGAPLDVLLGLADKMGNPLPGVTITNNITVDGVITDPAATGRAVADAINAAANQGGAVISAGAVQ